MKSDAAAPTGVHFVPRMDGKGERPGSCESTMRTALIVTTGSTSVHVGRAADNADRSVRLLAAFVLVSLTSVAAVQAQTGRLPVSQTSGSVPTGTATNDVRHLTLRDTIEMALRYNLGAIEIFSLVNKRG